MPRYTLTISPDYVKNWTPKDAIRELLQNWIDQETIDKDNLKSLVLTEDSLILSNRKSVLNKSTLLLGGGTKDGTKTIGQFGEGYKMAILVLLRDNISCEIRNYGLNELWTPKLVKSKIYNSKVLAIDTKDYVRKKNDKDSLEIHISNVPNVQNILDEIWLNFNDRSYCKLDCDSGEILLEPKFKGHIYIKGLLITNRSNLEYGYNFNHNIIKIGRDRNIVSGSDLEEATARLWREALNSIEPDDGIHVEAYQLALNMVITNSRDICFLCEYELSNEFKDYVASQYEGKYVIHSDGDKKAIYDTFGDVETTVVPYLIKEIVHVKSHSIGTPIRVKSTKDLLLEFIDRNKDLTPTHIEELQNIIKGD